MGRVAVLSCGPSLAAYPGPQGYDDTVAVNHALERVHTASCWALADWYNLERRGDGPHPTVVFLKHHGLDRIQRRELHLLEFLEGRTVVLFEDITFTGLADRTWRTFTVTAALMLAVARGADQVDVYGHDMQGLEDFAGVSTGRGVRRTPARWALERGVWRKCVRYVEGLGVTVRRVPAGVPLVNLGGEVAP